MTSAQRSDFSAWPGLRNALNPPVVEPLLDDAQRQRILAEQIRLAYRNNSTIVATAIFAKTLVVVLLWGQVPTQRLVLWWTAAVSIHAVGLPVMLRLRKSDWQTQSRRMIWSNFAIVLTAAVIWASAPYLLAPRAIEYEILLLLVVCVGASVSTLHYAVHLPTLYMLNGLVLGAFAIQLALQGGYIRYALAVGTLVLLWTVIALGRNFNRTLIQAIVLNLQNEALAQQIALQKETAEQASLAKTRFLAAASHDLRQPMHTIGLLVGIMRERAYFPDDRRMLDNTLIDKVYGAVQAMEGLFQGLLDISKLDAGTMRPIVTECPVAELLDLLKLNYAPQAEEKNLVLKILPSQSVIVSDPAILERILDNLVANAIRYTPRGKVLVGCRRRGDQLVIQIWDTGLGIPAEHLDDVFQEFFQLHNPERDRSEGLGLGLSIVKRSADLLGHTVRVVSRPGRGSCFSIAVPRVAQPRPPPNGADEPTTHNDALTGNFIVVLDDEREVRFAMDSLLQQWGCHTLLAATSAEAVAKLGEHLRAPDLLISDYRLRNHDNGLAAIAALRAALGEDVPALVVTGDIATADLQQVAALGLPLLRKPVGAKHLRKAMIAALGRDGRNTA